MNEPQTVAIGVLASLMSERQNKGKGKSENEQLAQYLVSQLDKMTHKKQRQARRQILVMTDDMEDGIE